MSKDFSNIGNKPAYENSYTNMGKAATKKRAYTKKAPASPEEAAKRANEMRTQGREGCKLPRITMAFSPDNYEYIRLVSVATGKTMTAFINDIMTEHRENHQELLEQVKDLRSKL